MSPKTLQVIGLIVSVQDTLKSPNRECLITLLVVFLFAVAGSNLSCAVSFLVGLLR